MKITKYILLSTITLCVADAKPVKKMAGMAGKTRNTTTVARAANKSKSVAKKAKDAIATIGHIAKMASGLTRNAASAGKEIGNEVSSIQDNFDEDDRDQRRAQGRRKQKRQRRGHGRQERNRNRGNQQVVRHDEYDEDEGEDNRATASADHYERRRNDYHQTARYDQNGHEIGAPQAVKSTVKRKQFRQERLSPQQLQSSDAYAAAATPQRDEGVRQQTEPQDRQSQQWHVKKIKIQRK